MTSALDARSEATRDAIIQAATLLIARGGLARATLRAVTNDAGANLAAVNYHFRSRQGLLQAVFDRPMGQIKQRRSELLRSAQAQPRRARSAQTGLIVEALYWPLFEHFAHPGGETELRAVAELRLDRSEEARRIITSHEGAAMEPFTKAFRAALPDLAAARLNTRLHLVNSGVWVWLGSPLSESLAKGGRPGLRDAFLELQAFAVAGLMSPAPSSGRR